MIRRMAAENNISVFTALSTVKLSSMFWRTSQCRFQPLTPTSSKGATMYKRNIYTVLENKNIAKDVYRMVLEGDTSFITAPGQFINIEIEGYYFRRPISICDWDDKPLR